MPESIDPSGHFVFMKFGVARPFLFERHLDVVRGSTGGWINFFLQILKKIG